MGLVTIPIKKEMKNKQVEHDHLLKITLFVQISVRDLSTVIIWWAHKNPFKTGLDRTRYNLSQF